MSQTEKKRVQKVMMRYGCNGKKCACMPWCSTTASNSLVGSFIQLIHLPWAYSVADLQISQADLSLPMHKACLVLRLCGQTINIMAIVPFPQIWYKKQNLSKRTSIIANSLMTVFCTWPCQCHFLNYQMRLIFKVLYLPQSLMKILETLYIVFSTW